MSWTGSRPSCDGAGPEGYSAFRDLDDDLWSLLLTLEYESLPGIRGFLPDLPDPDLQQMWNGTSGAALAAQSVCFYRRLKEAWAEHGPGRSRPGERARLRLRLGTADPDARPRRRARQPLRLRSGREHPRGARENGSRPSWPGASSCPRALPFETSFDLVFSFSVFTHISERAHLASLEAIHDALEPGGLFVATIRPPSYLDFNPLMKPAVEALARTVTGALAEPRYLFAPHETEGHPQFGGEQMDYGETVITLPYVRDNWTRWFDLLDVSVMTGDMYQVVLTLRKVS